jgi:hypothetical protein
MIPVLNRVDRHPWAPLGLVVTAFALLAIPVVFFIALFLLGEAAIGS